MRKERERTAERRSREGFAEVAKKSKTKFWYSFCDFCATFVPLLRSGPALQSAFSSASSGQQRLHLAQSGEGFDARVGHFGALHREVLVKVFAMLDVLVKVMRRQHG